MSYLELREIVERGFEGKAVVDNSKITLGDIADGWLNCKRKLGLKYERSPAKELTNGERLRIYNARKVKENVLDIIEKGTESLGGRFQKVSADLFPQADYDLLSLLSALIELDGTRYGVCIFTVREGAFRYIDGPKDTHQLMAEMVLYLAGGELDYVVVYYADREGENGVSDPFLVSRNDQRAKSALGLLEEITSNPGSTSLPTAEISLKYKPLKNGDNSVEIVAWQCERCDYYEVSCPGAIYSKYLGLGVLGKDVAGEGKFKPDKLKEKVEEEHVEMLSRLIEDALTRDRLRVLSWVCEVFFGIEVQDAGKADS